MQIELIIYITDQDSLGIIWRYNQMAFTRHIIATKEFQ